MNKILFIFFMVCTILSGKVYAEVLTFDDIGTPTDPVYAPIGNYGGFTWGTDFYYINGSYNSSFANGVESGDYVAFNGGGQDDYLSITSGDAFNFEGAYLTSVYWASLEIDIEGYSNGGGNYQSITIRINQTRTWYDINFNNIEELVFYSVNYFAMDNFTATPEPSTTTLLFLGGGILGIAGYRKRK